VREAGKPYTVSDATLTHVGSGTCAPVKDIRGSSEATEGDQESIETSETQPLTVPDEGEAAVRAKAREPSRPVGEVCDRDTNAWMWRRALA
jgi:hypothetical protein